MIMPIQERCNGFMVAGWPQTSLKPSEFATGPILEARFSVSDIEKSVDNAAIEAYSWDVTREQLVAVVMTLLIQTDEAHNRVLVAMPTYASAALEIVQAAEKAVAAEKGT